jgi:hypothetical protein
VKRARPGDTIVLRSVDREKRIVQTATPWTVVRHDAKSIVLYMPVGTTHKVRTGRYGGPRDRMLLEWDGGYSDAVWRHTHILMFHRFPDAHSIWLSRDATTHELRWWYVNLEEPWRPTAIGFDSRDHILDLWSGPDGEWHWKDEDELAWLIANARIPADRDAVLRAEGERAIERFKHRDPPLDEPWIDFRPDPSWSVPVLPEGWREFLVE